MASTIQPAYTASATITITLASLASSATLVAGRESTVVSNLTNRYDDVLVSGKITAGTSPSAGAQIAIWVYAPISDDLSSTVVYPDTITGSDAAVTLTSENVRNSGLRLLALAVTDSTSNQTYPFAPASVARLFGGRLPSRWGLYVSQSTGAALNATGSNHALSYVGVQDVIV